jgi:predicted TPR repeat methyltransferase
MIDARLQLAMKYHQEDNLDRARELYNEILTKEPSHVKALHLLSILEGQSQNFSAALPLINKAIELNPKIPSLYNSLGNILKNLGKLAEAKQQYEKVLELEPNSPTAHNNLAGVLSKLNHPDQAINLYRLAIQLRPDYVDAHFNLGLALISRLNGDDLDEAVEEFSAAIKLNPQFVEAYNQQALLFFMKNQVDKAIANYETALKIDAQNFVAKTCLGALLAQREQFALALPLLEDALALEPKHRETLQNLASIHIRQKNFAKALEYCLRLLEVAPIFEVYYNIGTTYIALNKYGDALQYFLAALKIDPNNFATLNNLGAIYLKLEDHKKASSYYKMALEIDPTNSEITYLLAALDQKKTNKIPTAAPKEYLQHLFDQYAPYFDAHLVKFLQYKVPDLLYAAVIDQLRENPCVNWQILDLGCGTGLAGAKFQKFAKQLVGIDLSEEMLTVARQKNIYHELYQLDMVNALDNYQEIFDLIIAADSLVYVGDLDQIFAKCNTALKTGGYFAFTCEKIIDNSYELQKSARFAHSTNYIDSLIKKYNFIVKHHSEIILRQENDKAIVGFLYVIRH